jgi:hypothetical protein
VSCTKEAPIINQSVPTDQASYNAMIKNINTKIDLVLNETKPIYLDLNEYKIKLLNGSLKISKNQEKRIMEASKPLIDYGTSLAIKNNIQIDDIESTIALGGLYGPNDNLQTKYSKNPFIFDRGLPVYKSNALGNNIAKFDLTLQEVGVCVITAAGADVLAALAHEGISSWTAAILSKVFSSVVKKFLGPVGVAIAVVSLTVCLANESIN